MFLHLPSPKLAKMKRLMVIGVNMRIGGMNMRIGGMNLRIGGMKVRIGGMKVRIGGMNMRIGGVLRQSPLEKLDFSFCSQIPSSAWQRVPNGAWPALRDADGIPEEELHRIRGGHV